jgi:hypothetical protein
MGSTTIVLETRSGKLDDTDAFRNVNGKRPERNESMLSELEAPYGFNEPLPEISTLTFSTDAPMTVGPQAGRSQPRMRASIENLVGSHDEDFYESSVGDGMSNDAMSVDHF